MGVTKSLKHIVSDILEHNASECIEPRNNQHQLLRCLEERISDPNYLWLIRRFLKAGVMEGRVYADSASGAPHGGVISPLLANIYLRELQKCRYTLCLD